MLRLPLFVLPYHVVYDLFLDFTYPVVGLDGIGYEAFREILAEDGHNLIFGPGLGNEFFVFFMVSYSLFLDKEFVKRRQLC